MKKLSLYMAAALAVFGMASCSEDTDPVLQKPTEFVLNVPAMQNQYIELANTSVVELVCSQPDYGYSAVAQYSAQMSLTPDFAEFREITPAQPTLAKMSLKSVDIATALCELHGIDSEDAFHAAYPNGVMPSETVYFRAVCQLDGVADSRIESNVVNYQHIQGYFAIPVPGYIYLVGSPEGWAGPTESNADHYAPWRLFEPDNGIGSKIYSGTFDMPAAPMFRFYTQLTGWDNDSYGSQVDDNPIEYPEFDGSSAWDGVVVKGKGAFSFPNFAGGKMTVVVNMADPNNMTVTVTAGEGGAIIIPQYIYMLGSAQGWTEPSEGNAEAYADWRLVDKSDSGIYTGTFDIPAGNWMFRFAPALAGWDGEQWGAQAEDNPVEVSLSDNVFSGAYVTGKGSWSIPDFAGGKATVTVNTNDQTVKVVAGE